MDKPEGNMARDVKQTHVAKEWQHSSPLITCRFDPKAKYVFSSAEDMTVQRWEYASGKKTVYSGHDSWVRDIAFSPDGETVITVAGDDKMIFWPTTAEKPTATKTVEAHKGWIRTISVSSDGKLIATVATYRGRGCGACRRAWHRRGDDSLARRWHATRLARIAYRRA